MLIYKNERFPALQKIALKVKKNLFRLKHFMNDMTQTLNAKWLRYR